jgi:cysteine desulfurase
MLPYFSEHYGNAASKTHAMGWTAAAAVDLAREQVAEVLSAQSNEILFCSGATEANNLALQGVARAYAARGKNIVVANTEHPSVLECAHRLQDEGWSLTVVPVQSDGLLAAETLRAALREDTTLVSVMLVNNEIGTVQDIAALAAVVHEFDEAVIFHCDAAQALGKLPLHVGSLGVDLLSLSAHKAYGPKGIGALWRRRRPRLKMEPMLAGGGHEEGLRAGTLPVPLIVGFGEACAIASAEGSEECERVAALRDHFLQDLQARLPEVRVNGTMAARVCGNLNLAFEGVLAEQLVLALRDIACSTGAACSSASAKPSHVLQAIVGSERAAQSLRFGLGRFTTAAEVKQAGDQIAAAVSALRSS